MDELQEMLTASRRDQQPPGGLEDALVSELRRRGLVKRRVPIARSIGMLLSAAALVAAGFAVGSHVRSTQMRGDRFILLLYGSVGAESRRSEYEAWARSLSGRGVAVEGEELDDAEPRIAIGSSAATNAALTDPRGYFIVTATDAASAARIAASCPHVIHGGVIDVRRIVRPR